MFVIDCLLKFLGTVAFLFILLKVVVILIFIDMDIRSMWHKLACHVNNSFKSQVIYIFVTVISVIAIYSLMIIYFSYPIKDFTVKKAALFGESFGLINALFTGLAFAGVIITLIFQNKQIKQQQNDINNSQEIQKKQNFETTFFNLIKLHNDIVSDINIKSKGAFKYTGRDCFKFFHNKYFEAYEEAQDKLSDSEPIIILNAAYVVFYNDWQQDVGHYFRNLYNIIKYVHFSDMINKKTYVNFIRAQLSSYELALLFYNCLSLKGHERFYPLVVEYEFLENMDLNIIPHEHIDLYDRKVFGNMFAS